MMELQQELLDEVFGRDSTGDSPEQRARTCGYVYVRSLDQIAFDSSTARGPRLCAYEALSAYGLKVLYEVAKEGSALLCASPRAAAHAIRTRRELLGLDERTVALRAALDPKEVHRAERGGRLPILHYEQIAQALGMDERYVSTSMYPGGNEGLILRLQSLRGEEGPRLKAITISAITEAAWVAMTQRRLEHDLGSRLGPVPLKREPHIDDPRDPAYLQGYSLAQEARQELRLGAGPLRDSLINLCESMGIPVIQTDLEESIAGVTLVAEGDSLVIVLNTNGHNKSALSRRVTLAHALGHLLSTPAGRVEHLRIDSYQQLHRDSWRICNPVEQRASAFAEEFIAPLNEVREVFELSKGRASVRLRAVMDYFGISLPLARHQIWHGTDYEPDLKGDPWPPDEEEPTRWDTVEEQTTPIHDSDGRPASRAGKFSAVVLQAVEKKLICTDTAARYLRTSWNRLEPDTQRILLGHPELGAA